MNRRIILVLFFAAISSAYSEDRKPADLASIIASLNDDRFATRQKAAATLIERAKTEFEQVVLALYAEPVQRDAEKRALATSVMRKVYQRQVLGVGAPHCGWHLERMMSADKDGRMVFSPIIGKIEPGSPAETAGLAEGDEILTLGGQPLPPSGAVTLLQRRIATKCPGDSVTLTVRKWKRLFPNSAREVKPKPQKQRTVTIVLGEPEEKETEKFLEESFASWVALEVDAIQRSSRPSSH